VQLKGLGKLKNPMTSGFKTATYQLVAQSLNQLRYHEPHYGPGVDSASNRNEYHEIFLEGEA
jgi:hypothetical protein